MSSLFRVLATILLHVLPFSRGQVYSSEDENLQSDSVEFLKNIPSSWSNLWLAVPRDDDSRFLAEPLDSRSSANPDAAQPFPNILRALGPHGRTYSDQPPEEIVAAYERKMHRSHSQRTPVNRRGALHHFNYGHTEEWSIDNPACGGQRQSPINLNSHTMARLEVPTLLSWTGYWNDPENMTLINNGHTVEMGGTWENDKIPSISGGPLEFEYAFAQLHFHWGPEDSVGSEHTVNNHSFPMEMHLVHYKKEYGSFHNAINHEDGLAVVAFFFEVGDENNYAINLFHDALKKVQGVQQRIAVKPFSLAHFHLSFQGDYVAYLGSLTTPPCKEIVTWIVSSSPLTMSHKQMEMFRRVQTGDDHNFRPTQPLNGRMIYYVAY